MTPDGPRCRRCGWTRIVSGTIKALAPGEPIWSILPEPKPCRACIRWRDGVR